MADRSSPEPLSVSLIERNPLAFEFLSAILLKSPSVRLISPESLNRQPDDDSGGILVFVIDNCGLPLPISECLWRLRVRHSEAKFLVLDHTLPKDELSRLLWLKIDGYLAYDEVVKSLVNAIHSIALGNIWVPRDILREYVQCAHETKLRKFSHLERMTNREVQILELVGRRFSNKEIAEILSVQESTVKFHLSNIYSKLHVSSRYDVLRHKSTSSDVKQFIASLSPSGSKT